MIITVRDHLQTSIVESEIRCQVTVGKTLFETVVGVSYKPSCFCVIMDIVRFLMLKNTCINILNSFITSLYKILLWTSLQPLWFVYYWNMDQEKSTLRRQCIIILYFVHVSLPKFENYLEHRAAQFNSTVGLPSGILNLVNGYYTRSSSSIYRIIS